MTVPPSPAESVEDAIRETVWSVARSSFAALRHSLRGPKISPPQFWVLQMVDAAGTLSTSEIAERLGVRLPTATGFIDLLAHQGWVRRVDSEEDRRFTLVHLTPRGERMVRTLRRRVRTAWHGRLQAIPRARQRAILAALTELETSLGSESGATVTSPRAGRRPAPAAVGRARRRLTA